MSKFFWLVAFLGFFGVLPMVIGAAVDGGTLIGHLNWFYTWGAEGEVPGISGVASVVWMALLLIAVLLSQTNWWSKEASNWSSVFHLMLDGQVCRCEECSASRHAGARRFGLLIAFIGLIAILGDILEVHVFQSVAAMNECTGLCLVTIAVEGMAGILMVASGLLLPTLIKRPTVLFVVSAFAMLCSFSAIFLEIAEHEMLLATFRKAQAALAYRESIAAVWITAASVMGYMVTGGLFGIRQYQNYLDSKAATAGR